MKKTLLFVTCLLTSFASLAQDTLTANFVEYDEGDSLLYKVIKRVYENNQAPIFDVDEDYTHPLGIEFDFEEEVIYHENAIEYLVYEVDDINPIHLTTKIHSIVRRENSISYILEYYEFGGEIDTKDSISVVFKEGEYGYLNVVKSLSTTWDKNTMQYDTTHYVDNEYVLTDAVNIKYQRINSPVYNDSAVIVDYELKTVFIYDSTLTDEFYDKELKYDIINGEEELRMLTEYLYNTADTTPSKTVRISYPEVLVYLGDTIPSEIDTTISNYTYSNNGNCQLENITSNLYDPSMSKWCINDLNVYYLDFEEGEKLDSTVYVYNQDSTIKSLKYYEYDEGEYYLYEKEEFTNNEVFVYDEYDNVIGHYYFTTPIAVSIVEKTSVKSLAFFPNPVENVITLEKSGKGNIYSIEGSLMTSFDDNQVNVSTLTKGIYMIQLIDESGQVYTNKFIKK